MALAEEAGGGSGGGWEVEEEGACTGGGAAGAETAMLLLPMLVGMVMPEPRPRSMGVLLAGLMGGGGPPPKAMLGVRLRAVSGWGCGGS